MQTELFPASEAERMQAVLNYLIARREKAEKALTTARQNLYEIEELIEKQTATLAMVRDHSVTQTQADETVDAEWDEEPEEDEERSALDGVAEAEGVAYDTRTGEVVGV